MMAISESPTHLIHSTMHPLMRVLCAQTNSHTFVLFTQYMIRLAEPESTGRTQPAWVMMYRISNAPPETTHQRKYVDIIFRLSTPLVDFWGRSLEIRDSRQDQQGCGTLVSMRLNQSYPDQSPINARRV